MTGCTLGHRRSRKLQRRNIDINFCGGDVSTVGGIELLRAANDQLNLIDAIATCLPDPGTIEQQDTHFWRVLAGIRVFATGGVGGVHRDVAQSGDVSADLTELGRTPVAVVCAGVKSILDIPRTLQYLETLGVPVYGVGTDRFPAFYSRDSGEGVDARFDEVRALARALQVQWALGADTGALIANPVPEPHALPCERIDAAIEQALSEAARQGVQGAAVTPFLLARVAELSGGIVWRPILRWCGITPRWRRSWRLRCCCWRRRRYVASLFGAALGN